MLLGAWTLVVWATRIRNAAGEVGPTLLASSFVVLALAVFVTRGASRPLRALAGWTVAVWAIRLVDIALLSEHPAGFVVVHTVLALVSIGLAGWAVSGRASGDL